MVMERALALAEGDTNKEEAVVELLDFCGDKRVSVVMARVHLVERLSDQPDDQTARAVEILEEVVTRLSET
jgi:hypothetical protein